MTRYVRCGNNTSITTPAKPAPLDTPTIPGSASGFFITACKIAPATAKLAPTNAPTKFRGKRIFQIMGPDVPLRSPPKISKMRERSIGVAPKARLPISAATKITANVISTIHRHMKRSPRLSVASAAFTFIIRIIYSVQCTAFACAVPINTITH